MTPQSSTKSPARGRARDPERSRNAILHAARDEFVAHGFSGARTGTIAKRAQVPQGLLYHYFENKEQLFLSVMDDSLEGYFRATIDLLENPPGGDTGSALLEQAIRLYFRFLRENPHVSRLMTWWSASDRWKQGPPVSNADELCSRPMELGAKRIQDAQEAGLIRPELDPDTVIRIFLNLCDHWHQTWQRVAVEEGVDPSDPIAVEALHDRQLEHIVSVVLGGVLTPQEMARRAAS